MENKLLVNACLTGFQVWYNGSEKAQPAATLSHRQQTGRLVIHYPELAVGLSTSRLLAEIVGGTGEDVLAGWARIVESDGRDVTGHYQLAAWLVLSAAREVGCQAALLTDGNSIYGNQFVYDGSLCG